MENENLHIDKVKKAFTHGGIFHADDVFSAALLQILNPAIVIERGNQVPENYDGLVFDIGKGRYDHHQQDREIRENGIPYAAFGLLWRDLGELLLEKEDVQQFDEDFVQPLDQSDNTGEKNMLAQCVADYNPMWNEKAEGNEAFERAVTFAKSILENRMKSVRARREAFDKVRDMITDESSPIFVMEESLPWKEAVKNTNIVFVIFPSIRGGYMVQAVPDDEDKDKLKKPFPENWRGVEAIELKKLTGIETLRFCHMSGFLCATDTLSDAIKVAKQALV